MPMNQIGELTLWQVKMFVCSEEECKRRVSGESVEEREQARKKYTDDWQERIDEEVQRAMNADETG